MGGGQGGFGHTGPKTSPYNIDMVKQSPYNIDRVKHFSSYHRQGQTLLLIT